MLGNRQVYRAKRILVTGGTGSIGSQIVEQILGANPNVVRVLSRDETRQMEFQEYLGRQFDLRRARFLIGDVRDANRLRRAMEGIDTVFHAAAMKHVPACEYNPFEAVQTNVIGTQNVITTAREAGVQRVVVISTDKATCPENTMGATKLLAERLVSSAQASSGGTVLCAVRFGNVVGSRGSIAPRVMKQLLEDGYTMLTDPEMTRFMMTIQDAVSLVLEAGMRARGGETFILDMPRLHVSDLIEVLVAEAARRQGREVGDYEIRVIGARPGEKMHERLITDDERRRTRAEPGGLYVVEPQERAISRASDEQLVERLDSSEGEYLSKKEILDLLVRGGALPAFDASGSSQKEKVMVGEESR
jgi:UDP-N-acetylglucosamine 4,6-dehydratase